MPNFTITREHIAQFAFEEELRIARREFDQQRKRLEALRDKWKTENAARKQVTEDLAAEMAER